MKIIDLSVTVNEDTPVYPGDPSTKIEAAGKLDKDGFNDHYVSIGTHVGTHIDAPRHMLSDGATLDEFSIDSFIGRGVYNNAESGFDLQTVMNT